MSARTTVALACLASACAHRPVDAPAEPTTAATARRPAQAATSSSPAAPPSPASTVIPMTGRPTPGPDTTGPDTVVAPSLTSTSSPTAARPEWTERPWWHDLPSGLYRRAEGPAVMAVGRSADHHHPAEGFLQAKVHARLAVRRAAGVVAFSGPMPEPYIEDFFITPDRVFMALYRLDVPGNAGLPARVAAWAPPEYVRHPGRRRVGRHMFEDSRHLYLECDVEGPIANPDWGQTRASARLMTSERRKE